MEKTEKAVENLMKYSNKFIFSVPHEPIWRMMNVARGKYIRDLGNTPGHIQHYATKSFIEILEKCGLKVLKVRKPIPWILFATTFYP